MKHTLLALILFITLATMASAKEPKPATVGTPLCIPGTALCIVPGDVLGLANLLQGLLPE